MSTHPDPSPALDGGVGITPKALATGAISTAARPTLMPFIAVINFALVSAGLGFSAVLLPNQLTLLDEANKVANLALVSSVSILAAVVVQPVIGAISDRTRSRWGRRVPWLLAGGLLMAVALSGIGFLQSVVLILALACLVQAGSAMIGAPLAAILADRYDVNKRGMVSAFIGMGLNVGYAVGVLVAATLAFNLQLAYVVFGVGLAIIVVSFVFVARDRPNFDMEVEPFSLKTFLLGFWINPIKHRDFAWAFVARFLYILAYFITSAPFFFILTDYIGQDIGTANATIGVVGIVSLIPTIGAGYLTGWLSDRLGRRKLFLYIACAVTAAGYAVQLAAPSLPGLWGMIILTSIGFGMYLSSDAVIMTQVLPNADGAAAKDLGILNLATLLGQSFSAAIAGIVITSLGGYTGLFIVAGCVAVLGALAVIPIRGVR